MKLNLYTPPISKEGLSMIAKSKFNPIYYDALDQIYHVEWASKKLARLVILKKYIDLLWPNGHPTQFIQVAGTSGKGSVCRFLEKGLSRFGVSGSLTSPHLFDYRERFSIDGKLATQTDIIDAWEKKIKPICIEASLKDEKFIPKFSEICILIALVLFERYKVKWAAIETGIGGRYDQTTALKVEATVITNIGKDHEHLLGHKQWQRALDKGGICRKNVPFFTSVQDNESIEILKSICNHLHASFHNIELKDIEQTRGILRELYPNGIPTNSLLGTDYQLWNATLSLKIIKYFYPDSKDKDILKDFIDTRLPGRFQEIEEGVYIDIAHNIDKINSLVSEINKRFTKQRKIFIISLSGHRSPTEVFSKILDIADEIIITTASFKSVPISTIEQEFNRINKRNIPIIVIPNPKFAIDEAKKRKSKNDIVFLTGSIYMIDQALNPDQYLRYLNSTYGWRVRGFDNIIENQ